MLCRLKLATTTLWDCSGKLNMRSFWRNRHGSRPNPSANLQFPNLSSRSSIGKWLDMLRRRSANLKLRNTNRSALKNNSVRPMRSCSVRETTRRDTPTCWIRGRYRRVDLMPSLRNGSRKDEVRTWPISFRLHSRGQARVPLALSVRRKKAPAAIARCGYQRKTKTPQIY